MLNHSNRHKSDIEECNVSERGWHCEQMASCCCAAHGVSDPKHWCPDIWGLFQVLSEDLFFSKSKSYLSELKSQRTGYTVALYLKMLVQAFELVFQSKETATMHCCSNHLSLWMCVIV